MVTGVILAAGMSTRMGRFKPMLPLGDTTFIKRIIQMMRLAGIEDILVVAGAHKDELEAHLAGENVRILFNANFASTQMIESIRLAIRDVARTADAIVLTPADVALPDACVYRAVIRMQKEGDCIRPSFRGQGGHPILINKQIFSSILAYSGDDGLKGALKEAGANIAWACVGDPGVVMDADTPDDYQQAIDLLEKRKEYIAVCGGLNVDIGGTPDHTLIANDSNPGSVRISLGGVARNCAHNLCLLDRRVMLFTAYGDDQYKGLVEQQADLLGIDLGASMCIRGEKTATYLFINSPDGNLELAINDMQICSRLSPEYFEKHLQEINRAQCLMIDANLPIESIAYLTEHVSVPIFADMVSETKAKRMIPYLKKFYAIKPNHLEAQILSGIAVTDEESAKRAGEAILQTGVSQVFLSRGKEGILVVTKDGAYQVDACTADPVNMTGAGDAALAALIAATMKGSDPVLAARYANAAASIAIESETTVSEKMSPKQVEERVRSCYGPS